MPLLLWFQKLKPRDMNEVQHINDIAVKLDKLHAAVGAEYNKTLQEICELRTFKPLPNVKDVFWVENTKDEDLPRLIEAAKKAVEFGNTVYIMPNPSTTRSMDFIFVRKGIYKDYDLKTVMGQSSVSNRLNESKGQSKRVLLNMATNYKPRLLAKQIIRHFETNEYAVEVLIYKGKRQIPINRKDSELNDFEYRFIKIWLK